MAVGMKGVMPAIVISGVMPVVVISHLSIGLGCLSPESYF
ncbi:hypothetical protein MGWOODY_Clf2096 [hydrothermal vent metagenome]|uniref:Uncharacterized protein n=1 Tax=hydrothermal vent metagenome TaxID=652676 RepID=A0A160V9L7_9ZZZZ